MYLFLYGALPAYMYAAQHLLYWAPTAWEGQKRASNPLQLEFQMGFSHCVGGFGNWTWVLYKCSKCPPHFSEQIGKAEGNYLK